MKVLIDNGNGFVDYTHYVSVGSIKITDSINVPTLASFSLDNLGDSFEVPKRSSYVKIVSERYHVNDDINQPFLTLATGFVTNEPVRVYKGLGGHAGKNMLFQHYEHQINVSSDEWLINVHSIPFIPAFVNQTQGQILRSLAEILCPTFGFDTTGIQDGDIVPYFDYDPEKNWSDIAKEFGDGSRYRYKVIDKKITYTPFADAPIGISYDDAPGNRDSTFVPDQLDSGVLTVPPVNDAIVIGDTEPQTHCEDNFIGDGFEGTYKLKQQAFRSSSSVLLHTKWDEDSFPADWAPVDPEAIFELAGALNIIGGSGTLGVSHIPAKNGLELGGSISLQHGEWEFDDASDGIIGGIYPNTVDLQQANCIAGFSISNGSTVVPSISGAAGVNIQPLFMGELVGPIVTTQPNHQYVLQTQINCTRWDRFNTIFRTLVGDPYGGEEKPANNTITFIVHDVSADYPAGVPITAYTETITTVTRYSVETADLPAFAIYDLVNVGTMTAICSETMIFMPPQVHLQVASLTGPTGGMLPIHPADLTAEQTYPVGFGMFGQVAEMDQQGDIDELSFYSDVIPAVGSRIRLKSWASGVAVGRVRDQAAVDVESVVSGDDGVRLAIITNMKPAPRTSEECEMAGAAVIKDREGIQFQGSYSCFDYHWARQYGYPYSGRIFSCNSPKRNMLNQLLLINTVTINVVELKQEILQFQLSFGPDFYLEKLLHRFMDRADNLLEPKDAGKQPDYIHLADVGTAFLDDLKDAHQVEITSETVTIDVGTPSITGGVEVRRSDVGWGKGGNNLLATLDPSTPQVQVARTRYDQSWYLRMVDPATGKTSRFSTKIRVEYPLRPQPPGGDADVSDTLYPVIRLNYGQNTDLRNIAGIEIRDDDDTTVLLQRPYASSLDLDWVYDNSINRFRSHTFYARFFNLMWEYSDPTQVGFNVPTPTVRDLAIDGIVGGGNLCGSSTTGGGGGNPSTGGSGDSTGGGGQPPAQTIGDYPPITIANAIRNLYVSPSGSDSADGSYATPWKTIKHAAANVSPGDVVHVMDGTYVGDFSTSIDGTATNRIIFLSEHKWGAKIVSDQSQQVATGSAGYAIYAAWLQAASYTDVVGFDISGGGGQHVMGIYSEGGAYIGFYSNYFHGLGSVGIDVAGQQSGGNYYQIGHYTIMGNYVDGCLYGLYLACPDGYVANNVIINSQSWGIHCWHNPSNITIEYNTIDGAGSSNGGDGMVFGMYDSPWGGSTSHKMNNVVVRSNIITNTHRYAINQMHPETQGTGNTASTNIYHNCPSGFAPSGYGWTYSNNTNVDPQFVSSTDRHILSTSPAVDKGTSPAPDTDFDGNSRPAQAAADIGAYEYIPPAPVQQSTTLAASSVGGYVLTSGPRTLYVATTGNDNTGNGSLSTPWRTISKAASSAQPGDVIRVQDGTYNENITSSISGTSGNIITIAAEHQYGAKIVGSTDTIWTNSASYIDITGFDITGSSASYGINSTGNNVRIYRCRVHDIVASTAGAGIIHSSITTVGCESYNNYVYNIGTGTSSSTVHGIQHKQAGGSIYNNVIFQCAGAGIRLDGAATSVVVVNNTAFGNYDGIVVGQAGTSSCDNCAVRNNILVSNRRYGIYETGTTGAGNTYSNNLFNANVSSNRFQNGLTSTASVNADPQFVSSTDYHINTASPAYGAGTATNAPQADFDGVVRNNPPSIGAYESDGSVKPPASPGWTKLFGMNIGDPSHWPNEITKAIRLWDSGVSWATLESSAGVYDFSALDVWLSKAQTNAADVIYCFGKVPTWAGGGSSNVDPPSDVDSGDTYFKNFVSALCNHSKARKAAGSQGIDYYELWNEPNLTNSWSGTVAQMVTMATDAAAVIRATDPTAKILSPAPTPRTDLQDYDWLDQFWTGGGTGTHDIVAFHAYPPNINPTYMLDHVSQIKTKMSAHGINQQIWSTEGSWGNSTGGMSPAQLAGFVGRYYALLQAAGLTRVYWYMWDNTAGWGSLWSVGGGENTAGKAWGIVQDWYSNTLTTPGSLSGTLWSCMFTKPDGTKIKLVFTYDDSPTSAATNTINVDPTFKYYYTIDGIQHIPGATLDVGISPIALMENTTGSGGGSTTGGGTGSTAPTTSVINRTGNNTSASSDYRWNSTSSLIATNFTSGSVRDKSNNSTPHFTSKQSLRTLLADPQAVGKILAHWMGWFGCPKQPHIDIGYDSNTDAQVHRQVADMISQGIDGVVVEWYGQGLKADTLLIEQATERLKTECERHPGFVFCLNVTTVSYGTGNQQAQIISDIQYAYQHYFNSPNYLKVGGRPLYLFFDDASVDWNAIKTAAASYGNPLFLFRNSGGQNHTASDGCYGWISDQTFYNGVNLSSGKVYMGMAWPGFDGTLTAGQLCTGGLGAGWSASKYNGQNNGQQWLDCWKWISDRYSASNQLPFVQIVTWNDWQEGTIIEPGINSNLTLNVTVSSGTLTFQANGNENTVSGYNVYASTDEGATLSLVKSLSVGATKSVDISSLTSVTGTKLYVEATGRARIHNRISTGVPVTGGAIIGSGGDYSNTTTLPIEGAPDTGGGSLPPGGTTPPPMTTGGNILGDGTQILSWLMNTGYPTGYRVQIFDEDSGKEIDKFTIDHPHNYEILTQTKLVDDDYYGNRRASVTPFDKLGDGPALTIVWQSCKSGLIGPCLDPRQFGAIGDGVTDDTIAIQRALDAASCGPLKVVCIPAGTAFRVTPQAFDYNETFGFPNVFGYYCLKIYTDVTLLLDGKIILDITQENIARLSDSNYHQTCSAITVLTNAQGACAGSNVPFNPPSKWYIQASVTDSRSKIVQIPDITTDNTKTWFMHCLLNCHEDIDAELTRVDNVWYQDDWTTCQFDGAGTKVVTIPRGTAMTQEWYVPPGEFAVRLPDTPAHFMLVPPKGIIGSLNTIAFDNTPSDTDYTIVFVGKDNHDVYTTDWAACVDPGASNVGDTHAWVKVDYRVNTYGYGGDYYPSGGSLFNTPPVSDGATRNITVRGQGSIEMSGAAAIVKAIDPPQYDPTWQIGLNAIRFMGADESLIDGISLNGCSYQTVGIYWGYSNKIQISRVRIKDCDNVGDESSQMGGAIVCDKLSYSTIQDNIITGIYYNVSQPEVMAAGIVDCACDHTIFTGNVCSNLGWGFFYKDYTTDFYYQTNWFWPLGSYDQILNNEFSANAIQGAYIGSGEGTDMPAIGIIINGNTVSWNGGQVQSEGFRDSRGGGTGISFCCLRNASISNNIIQGNKWGGISKFCCYGNNGTYDSNLIIVNNIGGDNGPWDIDPCLYDLSGVTLNNPGMINGGTGIPGTGAPPTDGSGHTQPPPPVTGGPVDNTASFNWSAQLVNNESEASFSWSAVLYVQPYNDLRDRFIPTNWVDVFTYTLEPNNRTLSDSLNLTDSVTVFIPNTPSLTAFSDTGSRYWADAITWSVTSDSIAALGISLVDDNSTNWDDFEEDEFTSLILGDIITWSDGFATNLPASTLGVSDSISLTDAIARFMTHALAKSDSESANWADALASNLAIIDGSPLTLGLRDGLPTAYDAYTADDFSRSDANPLDGNWATVASYSAMKLSSGTVVGATTGADTNLAVSTITTPNDQYTEFDFNTTDAEGADAYAIAIARYTAGGTYGNFYFAKLRYNPATFQIDYQLFRQDGSSGTPVALTSLGTTSSTRMTWHIWFQVRNYDLKFYVNGNLKQSYTDTDANKKASGVPGIGLSFTATGTHVSTIDNWRGGQLSAVDGFALDSTVDTVAKAMDQSKSVTATDSMTISDALVKLMTYRLTAADSMTLTDQITLPNSSINLTLGVSDSITWSDGEGSDSGDQMNLADNISRTLS